MLVRNFCDPSDSAVSLEYDQSASWLTFRGTQSYDQYSIPSSLSAVSSSVIINIICTLIMISAFNDALIFFSTWRLHPINDPFRLIIIMQNVFLEIQNTTEAICLLELML